MTEINLREHYPDFYKTDYIIEVSDEVATIMLKCDRLEAAYRQRTYYHKAYYSLDRGDGIEYEALFLSMSPCEIYERKVTMEQLYTAIASLPDNQAAKRINENGRIVVVSSGGTRMLLSGTTMYLESKGAFAFA